MKREATQRYAAAIEAAISQAKADRANIAAENGAKAYAYEAEDGAQAYAYPDGYGISWGVKGPQGVHVLRGYRRGEGDMLTATQCKMARAAIPWGMKDLAEASGVSANIIADFEYGRNMPIPATLVALRQAFEANGVVGFTKDGGCGWFGNSDMLLTRSQCMVARTALSWDINDLAKRVAGVVNVNTIDRFENGQSMPIAATQKALRQAFEEAGVRFTEEEGRPLPTMWVAVTSG